MATGWNSSSGAELLRVLRETKDAAAVDRLLCQYLPLAHRIAGKFRDSGGCLGEITQAATSGLYQALLENDSGPDQDMVTLVVAVIVDNIKDCLREQIRGDKGLRKLQTRRLAVERAAVSLTLDLGRPPTVAELAQDTGLSKEGVCEAFELEGGGVNFALSDDQAHEDLNLTPPKGMSDGNESGPGRQLRRKAELLI